MASSTSKSNVEKTEVLHLCKERKRFIKRAVDSRFAEAEALIPSSLSTSTTESEDETPSPSHSSYPSASPSNVAYVADSASPLSPPVLSRLSYLRSVATTALSFADDLSSNRNNTTTISIEDDESVDFSMPPPPPESAVSWDFFDHSDHENGCVNVYGKKEASHLMEEDREQKMTNTGSVTSDVYLYAKGPELAHKLRTSSVKLSDKKNGNAFDSQGFEGSSRKQLDCEANKLDAHLCSNESAVLVHKGEDPSEFITHWAKEFLSSIKDIEHQFFRASESGEEVSRMLEANKIRIGFTDIEGSSPNLAIAVAHRLVCCQGKDGLTSLEPPHVPKVIKWNRSTSSQSSSSRNPLATSSKHDADCNGIDFAEDLFMISGSHSSTLDRLYAWERKLHDEVKVLTQASLLLKCIAIFMLIWLL
ncbi:hypothetical protein Nepgr_007752 [Nepenthes gracilis]|uniref:DUF632 domain-containing protein n=1 Tax=Nepenthes gracilis TaxID=150966 RepID=A0AAD3S8C3_NEPGR|nr:hypothetical protein Nepgr_007752 [Nepenthes gracilis]